MRSKSANIQDVARAAGVSTATVSRALTKPDLLSPATRTAVFDAIQQTGYRVNVTARNLRRKQAGAVLVLVPNLGNPFFSQILSGISAGFAGTEYSVLIADSQFIPQRQRNLVDRFLNGQIDGMISLDGGLSAQDLAVFDQNKLSDKIVFACEWVNGSTLPSVRSDNEKGARLAMQHLYDLGHRRIAHITGPQDNVLTLARRNGVMHERQRLGLPANPEWIIRGDFSLESGRAAADKILAMSDRPTAVFCASDEVAAGLIAGLSAGGIRVPQDISVVGFDDIEQSAFYIPSITTIRQNRRALGERAAQLLIHQLGHTEDDIDLMPLIDVELVVRDSTAQIGTSA